VKHIKLAFEDGLATLTLASPPNNRFGIDMVNEINDAVDEIAEKKARAILLCADGDDFCFGGDIEPWPRLRPQDLQANFERFMLVFNRLERLPVPIIGAVQGLCNGGGFELALRADILFAAEDARFSHSEQSLGFVTVLGGVYRVAERVGSRLAYQWALTSEKVPAAVMERHGLVNKLFARDRLLAEATGFAKQVASGATMAHAAHKALLRSWSVGGVAATDDVMFDLTNHLLDSADMKKGIASAYAAFVSGGERPVITFDGR